MKIKIHKQEDLNTYEINLSSGTLLDGLQHIKETIDPTLTFQKGCKSEICGCCGVLVDGKPTLACATKMHDEMEVAPLSYHIQKRDLVVEKTFAQELIKQTKAYLDEPNKTVKPSKIDEKRIELQSDCILCTLCYSVCPVLESNKDFLGPFILTKVLRYVDDIKENQKKPKIDLVQKNGIWDCTLCGECSIACPQGISSKDDIIQLRMRSSMYGYSDPNIQSFDGGFGFDPNGF
jgi:fumarate reductase iron-sulfur subunit